VAAVHDGELPQVVGQAHRRSGRRGKNVTESPHRRVPEATGESSDPEPYGRAARRCHSPGTPFKV
jgi:hypothetical protein